ncbi:ribosomal subunit interface protein, putative [Thioalkalivibrio nitratireducens DSM 14787]|uniref:Ribosomal subunit interface protein, putative n=1 Tax=Thioalkalivibrio nitratireducens (strain DSM 14787 / UNIQEM 213 / ALEN2) TaxID=1255043 RepID=L0DRC2_THIND|nr:HPF/RaiA family ribosome-associated protein [Thioalkalivibrio nitratireducens]AGA32139.1 ribosomal subunit interface protein, putative [Thioalkalivibrio nitratireducens DSM 14787]
MSNPGTPLVEIAFRNMDHSPAVEDRVRAQIAKLGQFHDQIIACRVAVEARHRHQHKGHLYHVRIDLTVPNAELVASREPDAHQAHQDVYVAVRDAFAAMRRQLQDFARKQRGNVKLHEPPPHGHIREIAPAADYGMIETSDGREIRFSSASVVDADFAKLEVGDRVWFTEVTSDDGPAASTVHVEGKHHVVG